MMMGICKGILGSELGYVVHFSGGIYVYTAFILFRSSGEPAKFKQWV